MEKSKINPMIVILLIVGAIYLLNNTGFFAITLNSPQTQYYNVPVEARFMSNLTSPEITAYFNDKKLYEDIVYTDEIESIDPETNETIVETIELTRNQTIVFSQDVVNGSFVLRISNVTQEGIFKFSATDGATTDVQTIEVRRPYVDVTSDIVTTVPVGTTDKLTFKTLTPQGKDLDAESIEITVFNPDNSQQTLTANKVGTNTFEVNFNYESPGNYQFKVRPKLEGYDVREKTFITSVTRSAGIHPIIWIWSGAILLFLILFLLRRFRR